MLASERWMRTPFIELSVILYSLGRPKIGGQQLNKPTTLRLALGGFNIGGCISFGVTMKKIKMRRVVERSRRPRRKRRMAAARWSGVVDGSLS